MKTIRLTVIALLAAALAEVLMAPVPAAAGAPPSSTCASKPNLCLVGNFAFRLAPAKSFTASMASAGDPGNVSFAPLQNQSLVRSGTFTANGLGGLTGETQTTASDQYGNTVLVDYHWVGSYTLNGDLAGTLSIVPASPGTWTCTDETNPSATPGPCVGNEVGQESYAVSLSFYYDLLNMVETDNNAGFFGPGGRIFMTGQATKR
ncbi:MAG: hypothetical protein WA005_06195 [Candidatus Binataceae bacterium]